MSHRRLVDLSHPVEHGQVTYPGLPAPVISEHLGRAASREHFAGQAEFLIGRIEMVGNTGTYLDSPFHRHPEGADLASLPLERLADLPGAVVRAEPGVRAVGRAAFGAGPVGGRAVLVHTGWDRHWGSPAYFEGHPYLTRDAALHLVASGAALVGIDSLNIDDTLDPSRPAHTLLLGAGIPIVEHLTGLAALPAAGFRFFAVPAPVRRFTTFPVRALAILD